MNPPDGHDIRVDMRKSIVWCEDCQRAHDGYLRTCPRYEPPVDWNRMCDADAWEALVGAPKMAGPWKRTTYGWMRYAPDGRQAGEVFVDTFRHGTFYFVEAGTPQDCQSVADGLEKASQALLTAGWRLYSGPPCKTCGDRRVVPDVRGATPGRGARQASPCPQCMDSQPEGSRGP
jgi:hypothetical protein